VGKTQDEIAAFSSGYIKTKAHNVDYHFLWISTELVGSDLP
jgi:hypothetical protein